MRERKIEDPRLDLHRDAVGVRSFGAGQPVRDGGAGDPGEVARRAVGHRGLHAECRRLLALDLPLADWAKEERIGRAEIEERISAAADRSQDGQEISQLRVPS
jgi:hypothetical protein